MITPAEARYLVIMRLLDFAAIQAEQALEAAYRSPAAQTLAAEWDKQRETLLRAALAASENSRASPPKGAPE